MKNPRLSRGVPFLPSKEVLKENWSEELRDKIAEMDKFLFEHGITTVFRQNSIGATRCCEEICSIRATIFYLWYGDCNFVSKDYTEEMFRQAVAFNSP